MSQDTQTEMNALLAEIRARLPELVWSREKQDDPAAIEHQAVFYKGIKDDMLVCATAFSIEDQGFPPGSCGYDGACTLGRRGIVIRLTRELAEEAFRLADQKAKWMGR